MLNAIKSKENIFGIILLSQLWLGNLWVEFLKNHDKILLLKLIMKGIIFYYAVSSKENI